MNASSTPVGGTTMKNQLSGDTQVTAPTPISVHLMGKLQIRRGDVVLDAHSLGGPKPRQILEYLILHRGTPVSKDQLIEMIWRDRPPTEALATLESYVSVLRRNLQPGFSRTGPLRTATAGYMIERSLLDLDVDRFEALVRAAEHSAPEQGVQLFAEALSLASEPLFGDELSSEWAERERSLHATRVAAVSVQAAETAALLGQTDRAIAWARQALTMDTLNERAWSAIVLSLESAGRHAEALRAYEECRHVFDEELGCAPGLALRECYRRLLRDSADYEGELSGLLSAVLYLHEKVGGVQFEQESGTDPHSVRGARSVLSRLLQLSAAIA